MTRVVRPSHSVCSAFWIACSDSEVEGGGRLVEQDDRRVLEKRAGDRDALALPAGELHSVLAARRVVAALELHDEVVRVGGLGGGHDVLVARSGPAHGDVVPHRALEQEVFLRDVADLPADGIPRHRRNIHAVAENLARFDVVEPQDQGHHRRLAAARSSDEGGRFPGFGDEAYGMEDPLFGTIAEHHIAKLDPALA